MYKINSNLLSKHFQEIMKQNSESMARVLEPILTSQNPLFLKDIHKSAKIISNATEGIALKNSEAFKRIADLNNLADLKAFSEQMELISKQLAAKLSTDFDSPVIKELESSFNELDISDDKFIKLFQKLKEWDFVEEFEDTVSNLEKGHSSKQGLQITLSEILQLFMILLMFINISDNSVEDSLNKIHVEQQSTNKILQEFEGFSERIEELVDKVEPGDNKLLLVSREASIFIQPNPKSQKKVTVFEGQHLDLVDSIGRWYQVKYFNFESSKIDTGWIYKGNVELKKTNKHE